MNPAPGTAVEHVTDAEEGAPQSARPLATRGAKSRGGPIAGARARPAFVVGGLTLALAVPLLVALGVLRQPRWYPTLDLAWTELRVRDVASSDPPLIGLAGRIGTDSRGSHPGPLSFWAMWPLYRVFGATSWGLQAAAVALHVVAMSTAVWIAYRRGGVRLALGVAAVLAVLARAHGAGTLTDPWNPWLPLLWWMVFLLAVWSVVCDDLPLLPVAVFAGSFCAQTHVPYLGIAAALGALAIATVLVRAYRRSRDVRLRRDTARWLLVAGAVGFVAWLPPLINELTGSPRNLSVIFDHLGDPPEAPIGLRAGIELLLTNLNPWRWVPHLVPDTWVLGSSLRPGAVLVAVWATAAFVAWRLRHVALVRLNLVLGAALVLAALSMSRIFGFVWFYLVLWAWGIGVLMLLAVGWTAGVLVGRRLRGATRERATTAVTAALAVVSAFVIFLATVDAAYVDPPAPELSAMMGELAPPTAEALDAGSVPGGGRDGRYLLTWEDPVAIGSMGFGLLLELERRSFDVGVLDIYGNWATPHRVTDPAEATAVVHLSVGDDIRTWRSMPDAREVAFVDPRGRTDRAEYHRLRDRVVAELEAAGLPDLAGSVDDSLFQTSLDPRVPGDAHRLIVRMLDLGLPAAVFVAPPGSVG